MNIAWNSSYNKDFYYRHISSPNLIGNLENFSWEDHLNLARFSGLIVDEKFADHPLTTGIEWNNIEVVSQEPTLEKISKIVGNYPPDSFNIVAIGGGSSIDTAKAVIARKMYPNISRVGYDEPRGQFNEVKSIDTNFIAVPTTASSGAEASRYFLVHDGFSKRPERSWNLLPDLVIHDCKLVMSIPSEQFITQHFDAWVHAIEVQLSVTESNLLTTLSSVGVPNAIEQIVTTVANTNIVDDLTASHAQQIAFICGNAISNTRTGALHTIGESIASQMQGLTHVDSLWIAKIHLSQLRNNKCRGRMSQESIFSLLADSSIFADSFDKSMAKISIKDWKISKSILILDVMKDKVLWEKDHLYDLSEREIAEYLEATCNFLENNLKVKILD